MDPRPFIEVDREGLKLKTYGGVRGPARLLRLQQEAPQDGKLLLGQQTLSGRFQEEVAQGHLSDHECEVRQT